MARAADEVDGHPAPAHALRRASAPGRLSALPAGKIISSTFDRTTGGRRRQWLGPRDSRLPGTSWRQRPTIRKFLEAEEHRAEEHRAEEQERALAAQRERRQTQQNETQKKEGQWRCDAEERNEHDREAPIAR
jgi:hypothetical protein